MITLFACPRPFVGHIGIIQANALKSWALLEPKPEVLLIGDEKGVKDISREFGFRHIPQLDRNKYGTPLLDSIFRNARQAASNRLMCYVNSDIILMSSFSRTVDVVYNAMRDNDFLIIGRRWHVMLTRPWDFSKPDWERQLESYAETHGFLDRITGIDYFIFPKDLFETMPPLALGRCWHDAWIIYHAKRFKIPVVDATQANMIIHQRHDFSYVPFNKKGIINMKSPEIVENQKLCKGGCRFYNVLDATLILLKGALRKPSIFRIAARVFVFSTRYSWYIVAEVYHPYFFPIVALWRGMKYCVNKTASLTGKS